MMFRHELSTFLERVLAAVAKLPHGIAVGMDGEPVAKDVAAVAESLAASMDDVHWALIGLRASVCLTETRVEFEGIESLAWWTVHPQCRVS